MATKFIPRTKPATQEIVTTTEATIVNLPPKGALIRATLGRTVAYGKLSGSFRDRAIGLVIEGAHYMGTEVTFWLLDGWEFEILDEDE